MTGIGHNKPPRFILIDAKTLDHHIVGWRERGAPATRFEAWFDLLSLASWGDREVKIEGTQIALARGQLVASRRFLSERWGWSEKKVRNFQKRTIDDCMIDIELVKIGGQEKGRTRGPC